MVNTRCTRMLLSLFVVIVCSGSIRDPSPRQVTNEIVISYVGNMGVLVNMPGISVLIDGLHEFYGRDYLNTPPVEIAKIFDRQPPYINTRLSLATHFHKDHFSTKLAATYLAVSNDNRVAGPLQATESLAASQAIDTWNKNGQVYSAASTGLSVYAYNVPHTGRSRHSTVQNVAYLLQSNKRSVFHIGDADTDVPAFKKLGIGKVDVMIVPVWFVMDEEGIQIIRDVIKPAAVVATHISPNENESFDKYKITGIETHFFRVINQAVRLPIK